jgi:PAS domain S-box-containing protein
MRRLSEARHREIIETANEGICIVDQENRITFANRRFAAMVGTSVEDMEGRSAYDFVPGSEVENARVTFERRDTGVGGQSEQRLQRLDGSTLVAGVSSTVRRDEQGRFIGMLRMYTDATMRQLLTEARETLMRELIATQERERQRIARELHDQMGQHIVALSLGLARLSSIEPGGSGAFAIIEQLRSVVEMLGRDVHTLALELRPSTLDHLGLCVALTSYAEETAARSDIEIDVHCDRLDDLKLSASVETGIYRIAQEALTNVVKHAQARRVSVILERRPTLLQLIIEDDGNGFDPSVRTGKLGVAGMRERAALLGGTVTVETSPGNGATVYARIPLEVPGSKDKNEQTPSFVAG